MVEKLWYLNVPKKYFWVWAKGSLLVENGEKILDIINEFNSFY